MEALKNCHGFFKPKLILQQWKEKLNESNRRLKQSVQSHIKAVRIETKSMQNKLQILNPDAHLKRGFAIATDKNKRIIYSPDEVDVNDMIRLRVARGQITTKVVPGKENNG